MIDYHTHFGQFYDIYTTPTELIYMMDNVSAENFAASSTTICEGNYEKVLTEMLELVQLAGSRIMPVLWIVPSMLQDSGLQLFLNSSISWKMIKIHPQLHPTAWSCEGDNLQKVIRLAKTMRLPILIHTGEFRGCYPSLFEKAIRNNPDVNFILAHGRPIEETILLMLKYSNAWTDTAFMPVKHIMLLHKNGLSSRTLWGSDTPIQKYYNRNKNLVDDYLSKLQQIQSILPQKDFQKITMYNNPIITIK